MLPGFALQSIQQSGHCAICHRRIEERYRVNTPENIAFRFEVAGIGSHCMAMLVNLTLYGSTFITVGLATTFAISHTEDTNWSSAVGEVAYSDECACVTIRHHVNLADIG